MSNSKVATAITAGLRAILLYIRPAESEIGRAHV